MTCPKCNGKTQVINTRAKADHILRYRECVECQYIFRTIETDEDIYLRTQKKGTKNDAND